MHLQETRPVACLIKNLQDAQWPSQGRPLLFTTVIRTLPIILRLFLLKTYNHVCCIK